MKAEPEVQIMPAGPQGVGRAEGSRMIEVAMSRAAQEVQAAMLVAKKFRRDFDSAYSQIIEGCKRRRLAEQSQYAFPRGGSKVEGPSIRLAEHMAQNWGNFESGVIELERMEGKSLAMAYAWDLQSNVRDIKVFEVEHVRERREDRGGSVVLTDSRDIYELVANQGARRKRACILALIPGDIVDAAVEECDRTMRGVNDEPLTARIEKMVAAFADFTVTQAMLEARLGHVIGATTEAELVSLRKIYQSIADGMSKREQWFAPPKAEGGKVAEGRQGFGFKGKKEEPQPAQPTEPAAATPTNPVPDATELPLDTKNLDASTLAHDVIQTAKGRGITVANLHKWVGKTYEGRGMHELSALELGAVLARLNTLVPGETL